MLVLISRLQSLAPDYPARDRHNDKEGPTTRARGTPLTRRDSRAASHGPPRKSATQWPAQDATPRSRNVDASARAITAAASAPLAVLQLTSRCRAGRFPFDFSWRIANAGHAGGLSIA